MPDWPRLSVPGGKQGDDFDRSVFLKRKAETRRRIADAQEQREMAMRQRVEGMPDRSFIDQIEALRRLTGRQIALLEEIEKTAGLLDGRQFKALQSLAFVVRSLSAESRAQSLGWDPSQATDAELAQAAGNENGPGIPAGEQAASEE